MGWERIIETVAAHYGCTSEELRGRCRKVNWPRQVAMWLIWEYTDAKSYTWVGRRFGRDAHACIRGMAAVNKWMKEDLTGDRARVIKGLQKIE